MSLFLSETFRDRLAAAPRPLAGGWVCSGSPLVAEIMAGAGFDWLLIDMEHGPNTLDTVLAQLQAVGGSASTLSSLIFSSIKYRKPDAGLTLNGALAGLVGITAGASMISYNGALIIGAAVGIIMIYAVELFDIHLKIDDPVGAISVHGVCGSLGTLAIGLFATDGGLFYGGGFKLLGIQALGLAICLATAGILAFITFKALEKTAGLRVHNEEEISGLDAIEHGISAYMNM